MFVVVCYDIPDNRRRERVGQTLEGFGTRVQKSVFECDLTPKQYQDLRRRLRRSTKSPDDNLRFYHLCGQCLPKVEIVNGPPLEKTQLYFVV